jgi:hypothetical protein
VGHIDALFILYVNQIFSGVFLLFCVRFNISLDLFSEISYCFDVVFIVGICNTTSQVMYLNKWLSCTWMLVVLHCADRETYNINLFKFITFGVFNYLLSAPSRTELRSRTKHMITD